MLGTRPSDLYSWFDFNRFAELLIDGKETVPTTPAAVDANVRAIRIVRSAESAVMDAVRVKNFYSLQQLRDIVRNYQLGGVMGEQLLSLVADLTWGQAIKRKRYAAGTPQGDDPALKAAEDRLEQLRRGGRIFVLEGVEQTNGSGTVIGVYGQDVPVAGLMSGSQLCSNVGRPTHLWGTQTHAYPSGQATGSCNGDELPGGGGCCGSGPYG